MHHPTLNSLAIFCKVVDNFGDIGICWRLSKQIHTEHGLAVQLWVDDLASFQKICPQVELNTSVQTVQGIQICLWHTQEGQFKSADVADIVIEFFACDIPPAYIDAMRLRQSPPVWLNLEGLSAEEWVEGCHGLSSPQRGLNKYFFFPGFTAKTGGLLCERSLMREREQFLNEPHASRDFLSQLGLTRSEIASTKISLFCYPHAPVAELLQALENHPIPITCLVPESVASAAIQAWLQATPRAKKHAQRGNLSLRILPFLPQEDYDKLLWACDLNFVRGEDSFVRAQWAGKPFIWHIYPQDENLHHKKLHAFLDRTLAKSSALSEFSLIWNAASNADLAKLWPQLAADLPLLGRLMRQWQVQIGAHGDLVSNLLKFCAQARKKTGV